MGLVVVCVYATAWFSSNSTKLYWTDEIFSEWTIGSGNLSLSESMALSDSGRDGMMPLFYALGNLWSGGGPEIAPAGRWQERVLPTAHEMWNRLPSLFWTIVGFATLYAAMRKRYGKPPAALALAMGMFCTIAPSMEMQWLRAYGMLAGLTGCFLASVVLLRTTRSRTIACYAFCAALTLTHPYGILYAGAICATLAAFEYFASGAKGAARFAAAMVLPALVYAMKFPHLKAVKELGGDMGMWPVPTLESLMFSFAPVASPAVPTFLLVMIGALMALSWSKRETPAPSPPLPEGRAFECCALSVLLVPVSIWLVSQWTSFFVLRYFAPAVMSMTVLAGLVFSRLSRPPWAALIAALGIAASSWVYFRAHAVVGPAREYAQGQMAMARGDLDERILRAPDGTVPPVIWEDLDLFLPRVFYTPSGKYYFPIRDISPDEPGAKEKILAQNLVLSHEKSHLETGGRVGISPSHILKPEDLEEKIYSLDKLFIAKNRQKGTADGIERELAARGWQKFFFADPDVFLWTKNPPNTP